GLRHRRRHPPPQCGDPPRPEFRAGGPNGAPESRNPAAEHTMSRRPPRAMARTGRLALHRQRGMGLATALFVITVMAVLAVLIAQLVRNNAQAAGEEFRLVRAFYAA